MRLPTPLIEGALLRRYQRFLADIRLRDGTVVTAHCPNSGSMVGCAVPGSRVLLSTIADSRRKCHYTWQLVRVGRTWVGINTLVANRLVAEAVQLGRLPELAGYQELKREVRFGEHTRFDFLLRDGPHLCYVEVKNVTLVQNAVAYFPDAVTTRGRKHLRELATARAEGHRAVVLFVVQRADACMLRPADHIDPEYGDALRRAAAEGVECIAYRARVTRRQIALVKRLPCCLEPAPYGGQPAMRAKAVGGWARKV